MRLRLIEKRREASDGTTSFILYPDHSPTWRAGQSLHYALPHDEADDRKDDRYFTIASAPHETNVRLTTRFTNGTGSTFKKALQALQFGATIEVGAPDGDFVIDQPDCESIFIAGGIGMTPFRAMLVDLDYRKVDIKATLLYSNRDTDVVLKCQLDGLGSKHAHLKVRYFISPERLDRDVLEPVAASSPDAMSFVSGPEKMVEGLGNTLTAPGVPGDRIKQDWFPGYEAE